MSFWYGRGHDGPVVNYYYDSGSERQLSIKWMAGIMFGAMLFMATMIARSTFSGVRLATGPNLPAPDQKAYVASAPATEQTMYSLEASQKLQNDIQAWVQAHPTTKWSVRVESADEGGLSAAVNDEVSMNIASVYKLFLLKPLQAKVPSSQWGKAMINSRTYADCVDAMLRLSDNPCAEAIGGKVGWYQAEKAARTDGFPKLRLMQTNPQATANEVSRLLLRLHKADGYDADTQLMALNAMIVPKKAEGIRKGCEGCTVYNKIGELGSARNDVAIIDKDGKVYSVVILSSGGSWEQITELTKVISADL